MVVALPSKQINDILYTKKQLEKNCISGQTWVPACKVTNDFAVVADCHHVVAKCPFSVPVELSAGSTVQLRVRLSLIHSLDDSLWCF